MNKLSEKLKDAYLLDDMDEVERIKEEIKSRQSIKKSYNTIKLNTILNNDKTSAIKIYEFLNKSLGVDWWELEFETIERLLWIKYSTALEDINRDKIFAIRHVCRSDRCFADWFEFNQVALSFGGCIADFEYLRSPSPGMVISAVKAVNYIRPDRKGFFSNDVIKYICIVLINEGIYTPPPSLVFIIKDRIKEIVSKSTSTNWIPILKRYNKFNNNNYTEVNESLVDIQAKRLLKAEQAASVYAS